jgi:hypothetical protein
MKKTILIISIFFYSVTTFCQAKKDSNALPVITDSIKVSAVEVLELLKKDNIGINDYAAYEKAFILLINYDADKRRKAAKVKNK